MSQAETNPASPLGPGTVPKKPKKLVLCFDGTGNAFSGSNSDTNVVKLLSKLDRNDPNQFHYYQTGIGTYDVDATSVDQSYWESFKSNIETTLDQGFGTGFDHHVLAGYRFLMRYYDSGDKIYMFGFSRGAFTAKFLARMIHTVGLLCKGNEEMVPFAYRLYQRYLAGDVQEYQMGRQGQGRRRKQNQDAAAAGATTNGVDPVSPAPTETVPSVSTAVASGVDGTTPGLPTDPSQANSARESEHHNRDEITAFSNTFCRKEQVIRKGRVEEQNIKVYFLGMWDCVNSVAVLERKTPIPVPVKGTAEYVRHAVAVDERRVKFKAALLAQDIRYRKEHDEATVENIKEIWFPGCHGDVGGGWPATTNNPLDTREKMTIWQRIKNAWTTRKAEKNAATRYMDSGPFQMSDIPLAWMIRELELIGEKEPNAALKWKPELLDRFKKRYGRKKGQALKGLIHDSLAFGYGTGFMKVLFWKFMEWLPTLTRWELEGNNWKSIRFPLNKGNTRDIPPDAVFHESLLWRLRNDQSYNPANNHGGNSAPCLKHNGTIPELTPAVEDEAQTNSDHQTYKFLKPRTVG